MLLLLLMKGWSCSPLWIFQSPAVCSRESLDLCEASWQLWRGTGGLLERGRTLWDSVPPGRSPGDCPVCCAACKTSPFPTLDLEMLFSCANVLSCEAALGCAAVPELPRACRRFLSLPRKTLFKGLKELSHPEQWEAFSEENTGLDPSSACCSVAKSLAGDRR